MSRNFLSPIILAAGTTTNAPLNLQSGTNLTTAATGAVEFDGKVIYSTPTARGVSPSMMFYRLNSSSNGANSTAAQKVLGVGITLDASTVYAFNALYLFTKTAGATSHSFEIGFGGTATVNNIQYQGLINSSIATPSISGFFSGANSFFAQSKTSFSVTSSVSSSTRTVQIILNGTVSIDGSGTFIPEYKLSAAPGGAYSTLAGSYISVWPIGTAGSNTSVGPWS
jgi:hypothetical protein